MISDVEARLRRVERALATIDDQLRVLSEETGAAAQRVTTFRPAPASGTSKTAATSVLITVVRSCDDAPLSGVSVVANQGSAAGGTQTTDSAGHASFSLPAAGSTTFTASLTGFTTASISVDAMAGNATAATITLNADSTHVCCSSCPALLPATLSLSDPFGPVTLTWNASDNVWEGCHTTTLTGTNVLNGGLFCSGIGAVQVAIIYQLECIGAPTNFQLSMSYTSCDVVNSPAFLLPAAGGCPNPIAAGNQGEIEPAITSACSPLNLTFAIKSTVIFGANGATVVVTI